MAYAPLGARGINISKKERGSEEEDRWAATQTWKYEVRQPVQQIDLG